MIPLSKRPLNPVSSATIEKIRINDEKRIQLEYESIVNRLLFKKSSPLTIIRDNKRISKIGRLIPNNPNINPLIEYSYPNVILKAILHEIEGTIRMMVSIIFREGKEKR